LNYPTTALERLPGLRGLGTFNGTEASPNRNALCRSGEAALPRYYFNLYNHEVLTDETGQVFDDEVEARAAAVVGASELIASQVAAGVLVDLRHRIEIVDDHGEVAATIRFGELFTGYRELLP
jgi:hypothetical protein